MTPVLCPFAFCSRPKDTSSFSHWALFSSRPKDTVAAMSCDEDTIENYEDYQFDDAYHLTVAALITISVLYLLLAQVPGLELFGLVFSLSKPRTLCPAAPCFPLTVCSTWRTCRSAPLAT